MSKRTHEKELARARARRDAERAAQQRTRRTVGAGIVVVAAIVAIVVGLSLRGGEDTGTDPVASGSDGATEAEQFATDVPSEVLGEDTPTGAASDAPSEPGGGEPAPSETGVAGTSAEPCEDPGEGAPEPDTSLQFDEAPPADDVADTYTVTMETTCGTIVMELDGAAAPQTVASFVFLAGEGYYAGVPFHRVQDQFVIQGGDPTGTGSGGPGYQFEDELTLAEQTVEENGGVYPYGTLAMANAGPDTNGSQFFVVQAEDGYPFPPDYAVFGEVVEGMDVVDRIAQGPTGGPAGDQAIDPVRIVSVEVAEGAAGG